MWSDNESSLDLLGFRHLVDVVKSIVREPALLPATIGVYGDWGSGKSSLLRMVESELRSSDEVLVLTFNGWLFEGHEDAKAALMGSILEALCKDQTLTNKGKQLLAKLLKRVNWLSLGGLAVKAAIAYGSGDPSVLGVPVDAGATAAAMEGLKQAKDVSAEDVERFIREDSAQERRRSVMEFRDDFAKLLSETKRKRLVVVIDDLDRCMPETIIETLEAIKLFLFVPNTAFIIGADQRLVRYAVRRRFPELPGERADVGRDYLEKLVQFSVHVPPLGRAELETYMGLLYAQKAIGTSGAFEEARKAVIECDAGGVLTARFDREAAEKALGEVPEHLAESLALVRRIAPTLATGTSGNPRQCKRFLNALMMRLEMARSRGVALQQRILAKLMLLEYYRPESFKELARATQANPEGRSTELARAEAGAMGRDIDERGRVSKATPASGRSRTATPAADVAPSDPEVSIEIALWLSDAWVQEWTKIEPPLGDVDLRPYFFFSRDLLGPFAELSQRMSPRAQETLAQFVHESQAVRDVARRGADALSPADASAIFEALADRTRGEEDRTSPNSAFQRCMDWVEVRAELFGQLMTLLVGLPEQGVPFSVPPRIVRLAGGDPSKRAQAKAVLGKWAGSTVNLQLKQSAAQQGAKL